jgi:hypothetical protein
LTDRCEEQAGVMHGGEDQTGIEERRQERRIVKLSEHVSNLQC